MGNCLGGKKVAKVMRVDGQTTEFKIPVDAGEVVKANPGHILVDSEAVKNFGFRAKPLEAEQQLQPKKARLESLMLARSKSASDFSFLKSPENGGGVRLKLRLPKAEVEKLIKQSKHDGGGEVGEKIMRLCMGNNSVAVLNKSSRSRPPAPIPGIIKKDLKSSQCRDGGSSFHHPLFAGGPPGHQPVRVERRPHIRILAALSSRHHHLLSTLFLHRFAVLPDLSSAAAFRYAAAVHSMILCLLSLAMAVGSTLATLHQMPDDGWGWVVCFPADPATLPRGPVFFWGYVCYFSKILEFIDTLLILLGGSRSRRRLSFLHVFHHAGVVVAGYLLLATAQSMLPVAVATNAAVHVLMYAYYFLCALGHRPRWKKLVTDCQIIQFVFGLVMSVMETLLSAVHYWLVDHPVIRQYEWKQGHTLGASPLFVAVTVISYPSITLFLHRFAVLPDLSTAAAFRHVAAVHSMILCLLSLAMAVGCTLATHHQMPSWRWVVCFPVDPATLSSGPVFFWGYICYLSKILEFIDTLLILLGGSRSRRRLSFLHVFHHAGVVVAGYLILSTAQSMLPVALVTNAAVHVLMYAYYFLCALGHRPRWKKLVTDCQIIQFVFGLVMSGLMLYYHFTGSGCSGVRALFYNIAFVALLLTMFLDFHSTSYSSKKRKDHDN
nr:elongation of fatty acids protein 3-like [Ipomoea batatas]